MRRRNESESLVKGLTCSADQPVKERRSGLDDMQLRRSSRKRKASQRLSAEEEEEGRTKKKAKKVI